MKKYVLAIISSALLLLISVQVEGAELPLVEFQTNRGAFVIELRPDRAPRTVENFLKYVNDGFYDGIIFHRVMPGFMIQAGSLTADEVEKPTLPPISLESNNGLDNIRGSIAHARIDPKPDSGTSQFFINLKDNPSLDFKKTHPGYAVFGSVINGMETIDLISRERTNSRNFPLAAVLIERAVQLDPQTKLESAYRSASPPSEKSNAGSNETPAVLPDSTPFPATEESSEWALIAVELPETGWGSTSSMKSGRNFIDVKIPPGSQHSWVKIENWLSGTEKGSRFVRAGETVRIFVPLGEYRLKTASGSTWFGTEHLFGPDTIYTVANSKFPLKKSGEYWEVELIPQSHGNLSQRQIGAREF